MNQIKRPISVFRIVVAILVGCVAAAAVLAALLYSFAIFLDQACPEGYGACKSIPADQATREIILLLLLAVVIAFVTLNVVVLIIGKRLPWFPKHRR